jgi:hypothetical protein
VEIRCVNVKKRSVLQYVVVLLVVLWTQGGCSMADNINNLKQEINNISSQDNPNDFNQTQTVSAIDAINSVYGDAGYADVSQFMKNMAATESNLGTDTMGDYSFGATQIDPIRYKDIVQRASENPGSSAFKRADIANQFLQKQLNRPDFNILDINLQDEGHNPYISAALTRMGLANMPGEIPSTLQGQADYWKQHWNTKSGKGTPEHFMSQSQYHFPELQEGAFLDEVVNPASQRAF